MLFVNIVIPDSNISKPNTDLQHMQQPRMILQFTIRKFTNCIFDTNSILSIFNLPKKEKEKIF